MPLTTSGAATSVDAHQRSPLTEGVPNKRMKGEDLLEEALQSAGIPTPSTTLQDSHAMPKAAADDFQGIFQEQFSTASQQRPAGFDELVMTPVSFNNQHLMTSMGQAGQLTSLTMSSRFPAGSAQVALRSPTATNHHQSQSTGQTTQPTESTPMTQPLRFGVMTQPYAWSATMTQAMQPSTMTQAVGSGMITQAMQPSTMTQSTVRSTTAQQLLKNVDDTDPVLSFFDDVTYTPLVGSDPPKSFALPPRSSPSPPPSPALLS